MCLPDPDFQIIEFFGNFEKRSVAKNCDSVSLLSVLVKYLRYLNVKSLLITLRNMDFFAISNLVFDFLFWQWATF